VLFWRLVNRGTHFHRLRKKSAFVVGNEQLFHFLEDRCVSAALFGEEGGAALGGKIARDQENLANLVQSVGAHGSFPKPEDES